VEGDIDGEQCGTLWDDPVGDVLTYLSEPRPWANKIVGIAHNAKEFDLHFIWNRAIMLKWKPELITNGLRIISMKMEHLVFLDSVSFLLCALRKLHEAFGLQATKSWYPHYFSTEENLDNVGPMPHIFYYGVDEISGGENYSRGTRDTSPNHSITGTY
jgi:hypothetical protein